MARGIEQIKAYAIEEYGEPCPDFAARCINCILWREINALEARAPDLSDQEADMAMHWIDRYSCGIDGYPQLDRIRPSQERS